MELAVGLFTLFQVATTSVQPYLAPIPESQIFALAEKEEEVLAQVGFDLSKRWPEENTSQGFADNILISLFYLKYSSALPVKKIPLTHEEVTELVPEKFEVELELEQDQAFAFHKNVLPQYQEKVAKTMGSEFLSHQGYRVISGLGGNGVCHLASLINWASSEAGLKVEDRVDHAFAEIEGVPREYWTSIRYQESGGNSQNQNLYILNNQNFPIRFVFKKEGENLELRVVK